MDVSDITVKTLNGRAAMYTVLVRLPDEERAAELAAELESENIEQGPRARLHVMRLDSEPTLIDAYTFDRSTAEQAHAYLLKRAA